MGARPSSMPGGPSSRARDPWLPGFPNKASLGELARVSARALSFWPPLWLQSFFGPASGWWPPYDRLSEFSLTDPRRALRAIEYLSRVSVPALHRAPPETIAAVLPRLLEELFFRPTTLFEQPGPDGNPYPGERWLFINGIATNAALASLNAAFLAELFGRPVTVIQNPTTSLPLDIGETAIGKEFKTDPHYSDRGTFTEPALRATITVLDTLCEPEVDRVVLVAHSQGTIITANVLRALSTVLRLNQAEPRPTPWIRAGRAAIALTSQLAAPLQWLQRDLAGALTRFLDGPEPAARLLGKLEIYTFANCADKMKYVLELDGRQLPRIEHFANERDWVARLGVLSPYRAEGKIIDIDGPLFLRRATSWPGEGWGHLLNDCYLAVLRDHLESPAAVSNPYRSPEDPSAIPGLYAYFRGQSPGGRRRPAGRSAPKETHPAPARCPELSTRRAPRARPHAPWPGPPRSPSPG